MKKMRPPLLAAWMLEHLCPKLYKQELIGDLTEQFQDGRTPGWYWRQALSAAWSGVRRELWGHRFALVFAVFWTAIARLLWFFLFGFVVRHTEILWRISYPASLAFAIQIVVYLQIWMGVAIYALSLSLIERNFSLKQAGRALWVGPCVFLLTGGIAPFGPLVPRDSFVYLFPYFMGTIAAVWSVRSRTRDVKCEVF